jgi:hypothetical protein
LLGRRWSAASEVLSVRVEQEVRDLELVLWEERREAEAGYPSGAAAAMALIAFVAFIMGLGVAALILL